MKKTTAILLAIIVVLSVFVTSTTGIAAHSVDPAKYVKTADEAESGSTDASSDPQTAGWTNSDGKWSYIDADGKAYSGGVFVIDGASYIFDKNGIMLTGIQSCKNKLYYFSQTGSSPKSGLGAKKNYKGWKVISSKTYYFNSASALATGWTTVSKKSFYFGSKGEMKTGWLKLGKKSFFLKTSGKAGDKGKATTGWKKISKKKYYFAPKGKNGTKGKMVTGIKKVGKYRYFFNASGVMQKKGIVGTKKTGFYYADKKGRIDSKARKAVKVKGKKWNVLNGKATKVKNKKDLTLYRALKLVEKVTTNKMSKSQKLKKCFNYIKNAYVEKNPRIPHYHGKGWVELYANDMFVNGVGNCLSYAAEFAYIAKAIGYTKVYACHSGGHGWAEINGLIYDPEWSRHHSDNSFYALSYNTHTSNGYKGAIAAGYWWMHVKV